MNRTEFLVELERLLADISPSEREEALQYYKDFLDDAGSENDEEAIRGLGSPAEIAATIKRDLPVQTPAVKEDISEDGRQEDVSKSNNNTLWIVLLIVLCPFWIPAVMTIVSGLFTLLVVAVSLFIAFGAVAVALILSAVIFVAVGFVKLFAAPLGGVCLIGVGLLCAGIGILFLALTIWMAGMLIPALFHGIVTLFSNAFKKKKGVAA